MKVEKLQPYRQKENPHMKICADPECKELAKYSIENEYHGSEAYSCPNCLGTLLLFEFRNND